MGLFSPFSLFRGKGKNRAVSVCESLPVEREPEIDYYYAGHSSCLKNKFGETNPLVLEWIENTLSGVAYVCSIARIIGNGDPSYEVPEMGPERICQLHEMLFEYVYDWAGTYRQCDVDISGQIHAGWEDVPKVMEDINFDVSMPEDKERLAIALRMFCKAFNYAHPFVNGNGRTQMLACIELSHTAGYDLFLLPDDLPEFDKARTCLYQNSSGKMDALLKERLFSRDDQSELHLALLRGMESEVSRAGSIDMDGVATHAKWLMLEDSAYIHSRATGRPPLSVVAQIVAEFREKNSVLGKSRDSSDEQVNESKPSPLSAEQMARKERDRPVRQSAGADRSIKQAHEPMPDRIHGDKKPAPGRIRKEQSSRYDEAMSCFGKAAIDPADRIADGPELGG